MFSSDEISERSDIDKLYAIDYSPQLQELDNPRALKKGVVRMVQYKAGERRIEFGQEWEWREATTFMAAHWKSVGEGNLVMIFPSTGDYGSFASWFVSVCGEESYELIGENVEARAFCIADGCVRQSRG